MVVRLDDLPAGPARDGATSPLTPGGISGPIYGAKEFPVAGGRARAMLFRAGALIGVALAEIGAGKRTLEAFAPDQLGEIANQAHGVTNEEAPERRHPIDGRQADVADQPDRLDVVG